MVKGLRLDNGTLRDLIVDNTPLTKIESVIMMNSVEDLIRLKNIYDGNTNGFDKSYFNSAAVNIIKDYREQGYTK